MSFTTREMVGYHAECLCEDVDQIVDILSECVFQNSLNCHEIEVQKKVVYSEMKQEDEDVNVLLYDYLHQAAFQGTPLAQSVTGPSGNLYNYCDSSIKRYIEKYFHPCRTVLVGVGGITHEQMVCLGEKYLGCLDMFLSNLPPTEVSVMNNGLTIATEARNCYETCVGIFIDAGSRYEGFYNNGVAHFFEHVAFKGTCSRPRNVLETAMVNTGARFKSFTTREMVGYYAECLCEDVDQIVDILSECVFQNSLNCHEIEVQKKVVYSEMKQEDEDVNVLLYDYLHQAAFQGTPLAQSVTGPSGNLYNYCDSSIKRYIEKYFHPCRTVLVGVGGITHEQMVCLGEKYLGCLDMVRCNDKDTYRFSGSQILFRNDDLPYCNIAIAVEGPCFGDSDNWAINIAKEALGGWDRTQYGGLDNAYLMAQAGSLAHQCVGYKAFNINYKDTGLFGVQYMVPGIELEDMLLSVQDQFMKLSTVILDTEIQRAKRRVKTKVLTDLESVTGACLDTARWLLYNGSRPSIYEKIREIDGVTPEDVRAKADYYLYDKCPAVAGVGPTEGLPEYNRIRAGMYWLRW